MRLTFLRLPHGLALKMLVDSSCEVIGVWKGSTGANRSLLIAGCAPWGMSGLTHC
jgi:hypothetical protein